MSERIVAFSELAGSNLLEIGAGRPRSAGLDRFPLPILRVADVADGKVISSLQINTPVTDMPELGSKASKPGDVVLTTKGTVGRAAMMPSVGTTFAYSPQLCYFRPISNGPLISRYLYYWFRSEEFWKQADALKGQTDMADFLSLSDVYSLKMRIPSPEEQIATIDLLGALDDKIAANDNLSTLSDNLLATEFMRIRANAGWVELSVIGDVNRMVTKPIESRALRYVDISAVGRGQFELPEQISWAEAPGRARRVLVGGDTIWSTVRPNRRSHALVLDNDPSLIASTGLAVLTPHKGRIAGLFEASRTEEFASYLESVAEGSAYPAVRGERFASAPVPDLSTEQWDAFESFALPLRQRMHCAEVESRALARTRDELLPLLISGKLRVKDAEAVVRDVV